MIYDGAFLPKEGFISSEVDFTRIAGTWWGWSSGGAFEDLWVGVDWGGRGNPESGQGVFAGG